jgi:hypothetical protein
LSAPFVNLTTPSAIIPGRSPASRFSKKGDTEQVYLFLETGLDIPGQEDAGFRIAVLHQMGKGHSVADRARVQLYRLLLDMLDRLDAWETYLSVWHQLRRHTAYPMVYDDGPHSAATRPRAQPYVLCREPGTIQRNTAALVPIRPSGA